MRKTGAITNTLYVFGPFIVAAVLYISMSVILTAPRFWAYIIVGLYVVGFGCFAVAKVSRIRSGDFFSFGSSRMSPKLRTFYRVGYALMLTALMLTAGLLAVIQVTKSI